jgi:acyl-CoA reductase-like NAD-dependent aldehyde dehydrogenase
LILLGALADDARPTPTAKFKPAEWRRASPEEKDRRLGQLQRELNASRDYLKSTMEEHEAIKEELKSAHEEVLSANEEFQSTNEEVRRLCGHLERGPSGVIPQSIERTSPPSSPAPARKVSFPGSR